MLHRLFVVLSILALSIPALPVTLAQAGPTPAISIKTKAVEVSVSIGDAIRERNDLKADLLNEGKRWADRAKREADGEFKTSPELFRDGRRWAQERDYAVTSVVAERYVSILRTDYSFTGGAHPNTELETLIWDEQTKKRISIRPFFTDLSDNSRAMTDIQKAIIASLTAEKKARGTWEPDNRDWMKAIEPSLLKIGAVVLEPSTEAGKSSGLTFHYSPYAVGAYAEGAYTAFVPWRNLRPLLSAEGLAIFGGDKPKEQKTP